MLKKLFKSSMLALFVTGVTFAGDVPSEVRDFMKFANKEAWETHLATIIQERKAQNLEISPLLNDEKSWVWKSIGKSLSEIGTKSGIYKQDEIIDIRQKENWSTYTKDDCRDLLLRNIANFTYATPGGINDISRCLDDVVKSLKSSEKYQKTCILGKVQGNKFETNLDVAVFEVKNFAAELKLKDYLNRMRDINGRQKMVNFANEMTNSDLPYAYFDLEEVAPDVKACFAYLKKMSNNDRSKKPPRILGYIQFEKFMQGKLSNDTNLRLRRYVLDKPLEGAAKYEKGRLNFFMFDKNTIMRYLFEPRYQLNFCYSQKDFVNFYWKIRSGDSVMRKLGNIEEDLKNFSKQKAEGKLLNDIAQEEMNSLIRRLNSIPACWNDPNYNYYFIPYFLIVSWDGKEQTYGTKLTEMWNKLDDLRNKTKTATKYNECDLSNSIARFLEIAKQGGSPSRRRILNRGYDFLATPKEHQIVVYDSKLKFFDEFLAGFDLAGDGIKKFLGEW